MGNSENAAKKEQRNLLLFIGKISIKILHLTISFRTELNLAEARFFLVLKDMVFFNCLKTTTSDHYVMPLLQKEP